MKKKLLFLGVPLLVIVALLILAFVFIPGIKEPVETHPETSFRGIGEKSLESEPPSVSSFTIPEQPSTMPGPRPSPSSDIPSCGTEMEFFSVSPVALSDFMGLVPLGNLAPSGHTFPTDHIYFHINRVDRAEWERGTIEVPVLSPGDVVVTQIRALDHLSKDTLYTDYSIYFSPCREFHAFFIHLTTISQKLKDSFVEPYDNCHESETGGDEYRHCEKTVRVKISAGEVIGTAGGNKWQNALDLGAFDLRIDQLPYASAFRWSDRSPYIVCPLDYFSPDIRDSLFARFGSHDGTTKRTISPLCGEVEQDEPGTAQGVWFVEGTIKEAIYSHPEDPHLSLVHDNVDPSRAVFSVGTSMQKSDLGPGLYYFDPVDSGFVNIDFKDVMPGNTYCYETTGGQYSYSKEEFAIILELTSETTLRIERRDSSDCGNGPWSFGSDYSDFER